METLETSMAAVTLSKDARNDAMCRQYLAARAKGEGSGDIVWALATQYHVTPAWVYDILRRGGISTERVFNASDRDVFLGINISDDVKDALKRKAEHDGFSVSRLSHEMLSQMLREEGYLKEADALQHAAEHGD